MPPNDKKPSNDRAIEADEAAGDPKCFECVHSMPDLAERGARLLSAHRESPPSPWQREIERFVQVMENEMISRKANSAERGFRQPDDLEAEFVDGELPSEPDFFFLILTAVTGERVRHRLFSHLGTIDEAEGWAGIEQLLEKHLGIEDDTFHPDLALQFYRKTIEMTEGSYILVADIDGESDVINIRVLRPGQEELRYPNRFIFFESSSWWNAS